VPNRRLAAVLAGSGLSRGRFARAVCAAAAELGYGTVRYDHASVARWLGGTVPRRDTAQAITVVLGRAVGRTVTLPGIGLCPASPGTAGEPTAGIPPSWPAEVCQVRRRLDWLAEEIASLSRHLAVIGVRSPLVWPLVMLLTCPLPSCPETGHPLFVSTHVANSWARALPARRSSPRYRPRRPADWPALVRRNGPDASAQAGGCQAGIAVRPVHGCRAGTKKFRSL
jgi:hypothetical protein